MPRTVTTRHVLPVSAAEYMELRLDPRFGQYKASLEKQELRVPKSGTETDDEGHEVRWRSVELHFEKNPVPPFLRGLVKSLMGEELKLALDERNFARRCSFDHPTTLTHRFPKAIDEILSVESMEWVDPISSTQCAFNTKHTVTATVFGMAGAIEQAIENGIREGYAKAPGQVEAYLRIRDGVKPSAPSPAVPAAKPAAAPAGPLARWLGQLNLSCVQPRKPTRAAQLGPTTRRISVTVEDSPEELERVISMTTSDTDGSDEPPWVGGAAGGRSRTISVNISGSPDRRRVTVDESYAPVRPRSAWCRWCRCAQCLA